MIDTGTPMIRLKDLMLPCGHSDVMLEKLICGLLKIRPGAIAGINIVKKSVDARNKANILLVYTADVSLREDCAPISPLPSNALVITPDADRYVMPPALKKPLQPVIAGSGPCGLLAALVLAQLGCRPIVLERGKPVEQRVRDVQAFWKNGVLDPSSNVQFGEGGAGTFSDGKLASQIKDKLNRSKKVLAEFVAAGAPQEILYQAKPHIGTDNLVKMVRNIRNTIISLGGRVLFETQLTGIETDNGRITAAVTSGGRIETNHLVLALGHSARDTFEMLYDAGVKMEAKPFSMGVRIEHPQSVINKSQYGKCETDPQLGAADYRLVQHCWNGRSAYTFCMCPGGEVIASSSEPGMVVTNGMSNYHRNRTNANSALLVGVDVEDFEAGSPLAGIEFQRKWEKRAFEVGGSNYFAPVQLVGDFLKGRPSVGIGNVQPSYTPGTTPCDIADCLPDFVVETLREAIPELDKKLRGFAAEDAVMTAVESRSSSPVRILRDETFQSPSFRGLYPGGEGAGYAGGIMSAAVDGIKIAEAVINAAGGKSILVE